MRAPNIRVPTHHRGCALGFPSGGRLEQCNRSALKEKALCRPVSEQIWQILRKWPPEITQNSLPCIYQSSWHFIDILMNTCLLWNKEIEKTLFWYFMHYLSFYGWFCTMRPITNTLTRFPFQMADLEIMMLFLSHCPEHRFFGWNVERNDLFFFKNKFEFTKKLRNIFKEPLKFA